MQGLALLVTFLVLALISVAVAVFAGLVVDNLPQVSDHVSLLVFFALTGLLLVVAWLLAVWLTTPRRTTRV